jgi:hypothetical protein
LRRPRLHGARAAAGRATSPKQRFAPWVAHIALAVAAVVHPAQAGSLPAVCDVEDPLMKVSAAQTALWLAISERVRTVIEQSSQQIALVSRAGLDLSLIGQRYSHAGFALRDSPGGPWAVRQLYFACDEGRPRLFDQGLAAFIGGTQRPQRLFISLVLLPGEAGQRLVTAALDAKLGHRLLGARYSANAYPFSTLYQNCNQWLAELAALAWLMPGVHDMDPSAVAHPQGQPAAARDDATRAQAQRALRQAGYQPTRLEIGWPKIWLGAFVPWLRRDDHPETDLAAHRYEVSLPPALEAFVRAQVPQAQRLEFCLDATGGLVLRRGWQPMGERCEARAQDERWVLPG